jgi:hypothetical protein
VDLLFHGAKGIFRLDPVRTKNRYVAEALIWTGWLTLLVSVDSTMSCAKPSP